MKLNILFFLLLGLAFFTSCEDVIDVDLEEGNNQLVVDAWINNLAQDQEIILSRTQPYFQNTAPVAELGATVRITEDNGTIYDFIDSDNDGTYVWEVPTGTTFGRLNGVYNLEITTTDGKRYTATSSRLRVPAIDSISVEEREEELGNPEGIYCAFFARDMVGEGDAYWIKTYKNGEFLNKPQEINLAWDAAFTPGSGVDGVIFILPIREFVNRVPDPDDTDSEDTNDIAPWVVGDSINVELHAINPDAFNFMEQALTQMTLGDAGLFAEPPANVPTNINSLDAADSSEEAIGFFNVSSVSTFGRRIEL